MRVFGFSIAVALFFTFASCTAHAEPSKLVPAVHQVHPDARTKQTVDKKTATRMPRELAQQVRADQLEYNLIQEQFRARTETLVKRINDVCNEYGTQIQEIEFDTGEIHRAPKPVPAPVPAASKK